jgi:CBS domain-containing protein
MNASDIMVHKVVTVGPDNSIQETAAILVNNRISAVPVIDAHGKLIGIVSEGDLLHRGEAGTDHTRSWWLKLLMDRESVAREYVKEHSRRVRDVMTSNVITAAPETPLAEIAGMLERNRIKRVPIVDDGKLVGIVSRGNLVQMLAGTQRTPITTTVSDSELRDRLIARLHNNLAEGGGGGPINITVNAGVVDLWGIVDLDAVKQALRVDIEQEPGVRGVNNNIGVCRLSAMT